MMDVFEAIQRRRSIRRYKPEPVRNEDLRTILEAARLAPSGKNRQPWKFIVVREPKRKEMLARAANNQSFIADADVVVATLSDPSLSYGPRAGRTREPHKQDPMIAVEHMVLVATALGYGTCWIGSFNEEEVKRLLNVPERLTLIALLPIGVPGESPPPRPRKGFGEIFFGEEYGKPLNL